MGSEAFSSSTEVYEKPTKPIWREHNEMETYMMVSWAVMMLSNCLSATLKTACHSTALKATYKNIRMESGANIFSPNPTHCLALSAPSICTLWMNHQFCLKTGLSFRWFHRLPFSFSFHFLDNHMVAENKDHSTSVNLKLKRNKTFIPRKWGLYKLSSHTLTQGSMRRTKQLTV